MNRVLLFIAGLTIFTSCNSNRTSKVISNDSAKKVKDNVVKGNVTDSVATSNSDQEGPTFDEVKADLLSQYNKIERIDTTVIIGKDSMHVHEKYYCLHDSALVVPKKYLWGGDKSKDFVTHNFASKILIIKNRDTIIDRIFRVSDFNTAIFPEEQHYAILFDSRFEGYNRLYDGLVFGYSITIPLTDVGVAAYMVIDKNGKYRPVNDFDMINQIKR